MESSISRPGVRDLKEKEPWTEPDSARVAVFRKQNCLLKESEGHGSGSCKDIQIIIYGEHDHKEFDFQIPDSPTS
jgi:hypothetical protein